MKLTELNFYIEQEMSCPLKEIGTFKLQSILFFAQIEYFSRTGEFLFEEAIRCYYDGVQIEGYTMELDVNARVDEDIKEIIHAVVNEIGLVNEGDLMEILYSSSSFLRSNMTRGHRLTKKILSDYFEFNRHYTYVESDTKAFLLDHIVINEDLMEELYDDLTCSN